MSFLNSTNPFGHVEKPVFDPVKAKELAKEVLGDKRQTVKFLLPQYGMARYPYKTISEFIQAELKPLGLDAEIVMVDGMTSRKMMAKGDYDLSIGTRGLGNLDPTSLLLNISLQRALRIKLAASVITIRKWMPVLKH